MGNVSMRLGEERQGKFDRYVVSRLAVALLLVHGFCLLSRSDYLRLDLAGDGLIGSEGASTDSSIEVVEVLEETLRDTLLVWSHA